MADDDKTIKVSRSGYDAMDEMRKLFMRHGLDAVPPSFVTLVHEELATRKSDDAYPRGAVQSIAARIGLRIMQDYVGKPSKATK